MKLRICFFLLLGLTFFLSACDNDDPEPGKGKGTRTVLAYIMADNNLSKFSADDINEMMEGMKQVNASGCNLLVYTDEQYSTPVLYHIYKNKKGIVQKEAIREYEEQISTDAAVMQEVIQRAFSEYPADSYGLIIWSHGEGWIPSPLPVKKNVSTRWIGQDTTDGTHYLNITDMASVFETVPHLDFILFDACFGQSIEVAYELRKYTDYIIGSPTEIPGPGASYDKVVPAMFKEANVGIEIGKAYYEPYEAKYTGAIPSDNSNWTGGVSVSVINCAALEDLASVTKQTLTEVERNTLLNGNLFDYDKRSKYSSGYVGYYDMKQLMQYLSADMNAWTSVADDVIIYWRSTPKNFSGIIQSMFPLPQEASCGMSHYIPVFPTSAATTAYRSTAWYEAAGLSKLNW